MRCSRLPELSAVDVPDSVPDAREDVRHEDLEARALVRSHEGRAEIESERRSLPYTRGNLTKIMRFLMKSVYNGGIST